MVFDGHTHGELCELLGYGPDAGAAERQEALLDMANVVIGACVNGIAEPLNETSMSKRLFAANDAARRSRRDAQLVVQGYRTFSARGWS